LGIVIQVRRHTLSWRVSGNNWPRVLLFLVQIGKYQGVRAITFVCTRVFGRGHGAKRGAAKACWVSPFGTLVWMWNGRSVNTKKGRPDYDRPCCGILAYYGADPSAGRACWVDDRSADASAADGRTVLVSLFPGALRWPASWRARPSLIVSRQLARWPSSPRSPRCCGAKLTPASRAELSRLAMINAGDPGGSRPRQWGCAGLAAPPTKRAKSKHRPSLKQTGASAAGSLAFSCVNAPATGMLGPGGFCFLFGWAGLYAAVRCPLFRRGAVMVIASSTHRLPWTKTTGASLSRHGYAAGVGGPSRSNLGRFAGFRLAACPIAVNSS